MSAHLPLHCMWLDPNFMGKLNDSIITLPNMAPGTMCCIYIAAPLQKVLK